MRSLRDRESGAPCSRGEQAPFTLHVDRDAESTGPQPDLGPLHRRASRAPAVLLPGRSTRPGLTLWLGRTTHDAAWSLQQETHARRVAGEAPDTLLLVEHDSVYTAGRASDPRSFRVAPAELEAAGHAVREVSRGGDVTWHGPGQLVAYPIIDISPRRDLHHYLRALEDVLMATCADFGVAATRRPGLTGAWVGERKIASIGVRVVRWVTLHGTALNVAPDLSRFDAIVPCGIAGCEVTSIFRETGRAPDVREAAGSQARHFARVFGIEWQAAP